MGLKEVKIEIKPEHEDAVREFFAWVKTQPKMKLQETITAYEKAGFELAPPLLLIRNMQSIADNGCAQ